MSRRKKNVIVKKTSGDLKALCWSVAYGIVIVLLAIPNLETVEAAFVLMFILMMVSGGIFAAFAFSDFENF